MCKSHKMLHLCGCFLRHPDIEFCNAALARLNCAVEDVVDLSWCFCPDYPNCEVVVGSDTVHYRSQARLAPVPLAAAGRERERGARVRFRDGSAGGGSAGHGDGHGRDAAAGLENGADRDVAREEEESEEE